MPKKLLDIVYILKPELDTEELIYSLRSVEANFPHKKVWFVGGQPKGLKPDVALPHVQGGANKWERIRSSMLKVMTQPDLTEEFFLFNDDFFIMKPFKGKFVNYADKTLTWRIGDLQKTYTWLNNYGRTLVKAREELKCQGFGEVNYEVHTPMLFQKALVPTVLKCSSPQMRSIYGNVNAIPYIQHDDFKIYDTETVPKDWPFLSTNDDIFRRGKVGEYIRECFPNPSRFERAET